MSTNRQSIWRIVEAGAKELTASGTVPFTRGDLIKFVKKKNPDYGDNSINPIIQGVTDNLRGGAPGAVGKNVLHSVGRGQFMLADGSLSVAKVGKSKVRKSIARPKLPKTFKQKKSHEMAVGKYVFSKVCDIEALREESGEVVKFLPQQRYDNVHKLKLNKYGAGPYCKFKIPNNLNVTGVYAIVVSGKVKYIGECINLSARYNMGYGNISPRNCFVGGQETNCRINNLIFWVASKGQDVSLWFFETNEYKKIENELRASVSLEWNRI
jgi:hypothetical protein